mmetsp:Transcript_32104/g.42811  ORF Transcript_32104/g.42811 Transcript_32104/m.42811 type:complete len:115 (+) Transcript_32104:79-423(+)
MLSSNEYTLHKISPRDICIRSEIQTKQDNICSSMTQSSYAIYLFLSNSKKSKSLFSFQEQMSQKNLSPLSPPHSFIPLHHICPGDQLRIGNPPLAKWDYQILYKSYFHLSPFST